MGGQRSHNYARGRVISATRGCFAELSWGMEKKRSPGCHDNIAPIVFEAVGRQRRLGLRVGAAHSGGPRPLRAHMFLFGAFRVTALATSSMKLCISRFVTKWPTRHPKRYCGVRAARAKCLAN